MKIATDAAQLHDEEEAVVQSPGAGGGGTAGSEDASPSSPSSLPAWKKSIVKSRHVQAELLSLGLRESSKAVIEPSDAKTKGMSAAKDNDGTPEWMKKFQSMKFEKGESVIEAGGKQDPGVVTNGNGVVVSWVRSTTTQTKTTTAVMEETENQHSFASMTMAETKRADVAVVEHSPTEPSFKKPNVQPVRSTSESSDRRTTTTNEIFCQLCDRRGHSAKECPQLLAPQHEPVESVVDALPICPNPQFEDQVKEKKKKKKPKLIQEVVEVDETAAFYGPTATDIEPPTTDTDPATTHDPVCIDEPTSEIGKKKKKKKKLAESEMTEAVDPTATAPQLAIETVEPRPPETHAYTDINHAGLEQDVVEAGTAPKKKKKKKAAAVAESDHVVEDLSPPPTEDQPSRQEPTVNADTTPTKLCDSNAAMNESFSFSELSSDPAKARRKKKSTRKVESDDCIGEITFDSQSEVSKAGAATEATVPMNESYSSTGESSTDLNSRDCSSKMKKTRRKKKGKDEPVGPMSDSCSSLESSVVSSQIAGPTAVTRSTSKGESRTTRDADGELDGPETCSTSQQSSCAGSKSSSSRESTLSSKCSSSKQEGPSDASKATKERILEERIQIVNTLNIFLDQTKERMANRESRIPEGSLRANKDDGKASHQQERRSSVGACAAPSEGSSRPSIKTSKSQSARMPHRRRSCTGGSGTQSAPVKREGSRRNETSGQPPSSPRRRPGHSTKAPSRRRVARDPEPDLKPAKGITDNACEDVFRVVSHNASFQMSRQKICLPTDFDDFDEADLSDGNSVHDGAKESKADPFDDAFGGMVSTDTLFEVTETVSTFQTLNVTLPGTVGSFDRETTSTGFSFSSFDDMGGKGVGTDDFSVDPFGQSGVFDVGGGQIDLTEGFADASSSFWGSTNMEPTIERRRSVDTASSSNSATKPQRRRNGEAPTRISRRRSSTAGRSSSFQGVR
jgi:hypothetical protein